MITCNCLAEIASAFSIYSFQMLDKNTKIEITDASEEGVLFSKIFLAFIFFYCAYVGFYRVSWFACLNKVNKQILVVFDLFNRLLVYTKCLREAKTHFVWKSYRI